MAWFGDGLSSLRGQLSNLAKNVLVEEEEDSEKKAEASGVDPPLPVPLSDSLSTESGWSDAEVDTFIGQEAPRNENESPKPTALVSPTNKGNVDRDVAAMIPKGIANFFHQITAIPDGKYGKNEKETQTDTSLLSTNDISTQRLSEQNAQLNSEVDSLRRMVRDLESQVALSQDENANLSTGLEALDFQHQEAIEQIITVRDESLKQLSNVREELRLRNDEWTKISEQNKVLIKEVEGLNQELLQNETLAQENARLRERITELTRAELPDIEENSAAEEHVRTLESEIIALRESRDNLERETNTLLSQVRQRDAQLRQLDARVEDVVTEKESLEREMTQIVFDSNSLRRELKSATEKNEDLEKVVVPLQEESKTLKVELENARKELFSAKSNLEVAKRESDLSKDESETLKSELESLKEELGGEEAKASLDNQRLREAKKMAKEASSEIETLRMKLSNIEDEYKKTKIQFETDKLSFDAERQTLQKELDILRDTSRECGIQNDIYREKEIELKRQLENAEVELCSLKSVLEEEKDLMGKEIEGLKELIRHSKKENEVLRNKLESYSEKDFELERCLIELENLQKEKLELKTSFDEILHNNEILLQNNAKHEKELLEVKSTLNSYVNENLEHKKLISEYQGSLEKSKQELNYAEVQIKNLSVAKEKSFFADKTTEIEDEEKKQFDSEKDKLFSNFSELTAQNVLLSEQIRNLESEIVFLREEKRNYGEKERILIQENNVLSEKANKNMSQQIDTYVNEIKSLSIENELMHNKLEELKGNVDISNKNNASLNEKLSKAHIEIEAIHEHLIPFGGTFEGVHKLKNDNTHLTHQVDYFKDELQEIYEEKLKLSDDLSAVEIEKNQLIEQIQILRKELDNVVRLKEEVENLKHNLQIKSSEVNNLDGEIKRLQGALNTQLANNEILHKERIEIKQRCDNMFVDMQNKMAYIEEVEKMKNKEIDTLRQEVENLKTQLEYASQLLQDVERQDGEGQPSGESTSQKTSPELQEELSRLSGALLKEQTECKLVKNQLEETKEKLEKAENQLKTLKSHLVNVEDRYSAELSVTEEKLKESQVLLQTAEERARTSSTAYTSASIRSNQQVEALREQVRLLTEHKEKLEAEVSKAEDATLKQSATVTRLQAVLHQFQRDKQRDIEFETERIRRDSALARKNVEELTLEMKNLQEQLNEAKKGLVAGQKLSDDLLRQEELVAQLKTQVTELTEKLKAKEEKVNDLSSDNKVDRQLVKNLLVGYVTAPVDHKSQVLGVLGQVLSLNKEERQKMGLEPGGRQQSLSEAFIRFLQAESQPRHEVILPLSVPSETSLSRKSSLLSQEVPVLPHFTLGRNPGSILKDVLQERRPEQ